MWVEVSEREVCCFEFGFEDMRCCKISGFTDYSGICGEVSSRGGGVCYREEETSTFELVVD